MLERLKAAHAALQAAPGGYRETQMFCGQAFEAIPAIFGCVEALRVIAAQSLGDDWTPAQAIEFAKAHAKRHLAALNGAADASQAPSPAEDRLAALEEAAETLKKIAASSYSEQSADLIDAARVACALLEKR